MNNNNYSDFKVLNVVKIKGNYGFRIKLSYLDGSEKLIQRSGFKTKKEASIERDKSIAELYSKTFIFSNNITLKKFLSDWLEQYMKPKITFNSYASYKNVVYNHIIPIIGHIKVNELKQEHIRKLYNSISSKHILKQCHIILKTALDYA